MRGYLDQTLLLTRRQFIRAYRRVSLWPSFTILSIILSIILASVFGYDRDTKPLPDLSDRSQLIRLYVMGKLDSQEIFTTIMGMTFMKLGAMFSPLATAGALYFSFFSGPFMELKAVVEREVSDGQYAGWTFVLAQTATKCVLLFMISLLSSLIM